MSKTDKRVAWFVGICMFIAAFVPVDQWGAGWVSVIFIALGCGVAIAYVMRREHEHLDRNTRS